MFWPSGPLFTAQFPLFDILIDNAFKATSTACESRKADERSVAKNPGKSAKHMFRGCFSRFPPLSTHDDALRLRRDKYLNHSKQLTMKITRRERKRNVKFDLSRLFLLFFVVLEVDLRGNVAPTCTLVACLFSFRRLSERAGFRSFHVLTGGEQRSTWIRRSSPSKKEGTERGKRTGKSEESSDAFWTNWRK